jgi:hypothetical protein
MQSCSVCDSLQVTVYERADRIGGLMMYGGECLMRVTSLLERTSRRMPSLTPDCAGMDGWMDGWMGTPSQFALLSVRSPSILHW